MTIACLTQPYNYSSISQRRSNLSTHQQLHITRCWSSISFSLRLARSVIPLRSLRIAIHQAGTLKLSPSFSAAQHIRAFLAAMATIARQ